MQTIAFEPEQAGRKSVAKYKKYRQKKLMENCAGNRLFSGNLMRSMQTFIISTL